MEIAYTKVENACLDGVAIIGMIESKIHKYSADLHVVSIGVQETENNIAYYLPEE